MKRSGFIDFSKGILITLVTVGHSIQLLHSHDSTFWENPLFKIIYMFHMPLFIAISGYLSFSGIQKLNNLSVYISGKTRAYLLPIVSWALISKTIELLIVKQVPLTNFLPEVAREIIGSQWFLWVLYGSIVITAFSSQLRKFAGLAIAVAFCGLMALPDSNGIYYYKYLFPFFVAGLFCAKHPLVLKTASTNIGLLFVGIGIIAIGFTLWDKQSYIYLSRMSLTFANAPNIALRWTLGAVGSLVALGIFKKTYSLLPSLCSRPVEIVGRDSLSIYILQGYIFLLLTQFSNIEWLTSLRSNFLAITVGIVVACVCWIIGRIIASNKYTALLFFGKAMTKRPIQST